MRHGIRCLTGIAGLVAAACCAIALGASALSAVALAAVAPGTTAAGSQLDAILRRLARPAPSSTPFIEARISALLSRPLVVSGELQYLGAGSLVRIVEMPYRERAEIRGEAVTVRRGDQPAQHFSLDQAPEMRSLVASFSALLAGDVAMLRRTFALDLHGAESDGWTIGLTPLDPAVHERIRSILVTGGGGEPRCLTTFQANDDVDFMLLAGAARGALPAQPDRQWFEARCRGMHVAAGE